MLTPNYQVLWDTMVVHPDFEHSVELLATQVKNNQSRYQHVGEQVCPGTPVPWYFIGIVHLMEATLNFHTHLYNGDPLSAKTVHYPRGRPMLGEPPYSWEYSAIDALKYEGFAGAIVWDIPMLLRRIESYNGRGYWAHDIYSPYLWSRTNHYVKGKFEEILNPQTHHYDVHYNANLVSGQTGAAPILKKLLVL